MCSSDLLNRAIFPPGTGADSVFAVAWVLGMEAPWAAAPLVLYLGQAVFAERFAWRQALASFGRALPKFLVFQVLLRAVLLGIVTSQDERSFAARHEREARRIATLWTPSMRLSSITSASGEWSRRSATRYDTSMAIPWRAVSSDSSRRPASRLSTGPSSTLRSWPRPRRT